VFDSEIRARVTDTLDHERVRAWYYALMDYGVYVKKTFGNPNSKSKHYVKQSAFVDSDRQIRGAILRVLSGGSHTRASILKVLRFEDVRIDAQLARLAEEGMVTKKGRIYELPV
jgi:A/G-specific adenine glycosylase